MEDLLNQLMAYLVPILGTAITAIVGVVGTKIQAYIAAKANAEEINSAIEATVKFIAQKYNDLNGDEKLAKATELASEWLAEKNISVNETQLNMLIEAAVYSFVSNLTNEEE